MLVKQKAIATMEAKKTIVDGACSLAVEALNFLEGKGVNMEKEAKSKLAANLITVICSNNSEGKV